jgi:hypothetical protein
MDFDDLRGLFNRDHCICLSRLIEPGLFHFIQREIALAEFVPRTHERIGVELCMTPNRALGLLHFFVNDPVFLATIQRISGCARIGCFTGRVYRMAPSSGHWDSWHNDIDRAEQRMLGMSINLSEERYYGGIFELRQAATQRTICERANTGSGDALLFRLSTDLQHRITDVVGSVPKTAFAGWFRADPQFRSLWMAPEDK